MQSDSPPKVFLVDDDEAITVAVARLLRAVGYQVEAFTSPEAFLERPRYPAPCCLILDLKLEGTDGLEVQRRLSESGRSLPIIFISGQGEIRDSVLAVKAGAMDFLVKPVPPDTLLAAVQSAIARDAAALSKDRELAEDRGRLAKLTPREREVTELVAQGLLNKQIGFALGMAMGTVKLHRSRAMEKIGVDSVAELVRILDRLGPKRTDAIKGSPPLTQ
jgi:FixJ family two-component response regulator